MLKAVLMTSRPPFLVLAFSCISLIVATGFWLGAEISALLIIAMALLLFFAHISVNALNEAEDFVSGLDLITTKTPFSGGTGTLPNKPEALKGVWILGITSLVFATVIGLFLVALTDWYLILLGVLGIIIIVTYTRWINRMPWLCLLAPGIGLAVIPIFGGVWVMTGQPLLAALLISLIPALLINNLLLLNQFPDRDADRKIGRKTMLVAYGYEFSSKLYLLNWILAVFLLGLFVWNATLPRAASLTIFPMLFGFGAWRGAVNYPRELPEHTAYMAANVACAVLSPLALALLLFLFSS
ncbi:prenyltransferase [Agaribacterium sp. ZY112]|uniref:prenyltransferase n=1 Tax=Agaribacterium sp. ZY112 TaxID=3233574 RepID=UPI003524B550